MRILFAAIVLSAGVLGAACGPATMNDSYGRSRLLQTMQPASLADSPLQDHPMSSAALDRARSEKAPLLCDGRGPVDATAKAVLDRVNAVAAGLVKSTNPCGQGEAQAQTGSSAPTGACLNATTPATDTSSIALTCDAGKIIIAMDAGTVQLEALHGKIYTYRDTETLTLLGWETGKARLVVVRTGIDHKQGKDRLSGSFLVIPAPERVKTASELIPTIHNLDQWELFALDSTGKSGIVMRAPREALTGAAEIEAAGFRIQ